MPASNQDLFMSVLKVHDKLLITIIFTNIDIESLLIIVHPQMGNLWVYKGGQDKHWEEMLNLKIQEGVKLQFCYLLSHLWDVKLSRMGDVLLLSKDTRVN